MKERFENVTVEIIDLEEDVIATSDEKLDSELPETTIADNS